MKNVKKYRREMADFPAALLLKEEVLPRYSQFQKLTGTYEKRPGMVRGAHDWHRFQTWYSGNPMQTGEPPNAKCEGGPGLSDALQEGGRIAESCGHYLHPERHDASGNRHTIRDFIGSMLQMKRRGYCPVCLMEMCIELQNAIDQAWSEKARRKRLEEYKDGLEKYDEWNVVMDRLWRTARLELANFKHVQEAMSVQEAVWERLDPTQVSWAASADSATKAVRLACDKVTYPEYWSVYPSIPPPDDDNAKEVSQEKSKQRESKPLKQVRFTPDTDFNRTRENARGSRKYRRSAESYSPGRHAWPHKYGWANTSFMNDTKYSLHQIKIVKETLSDPVESVSTQMLCYQTPTMEEYLQPHPLKAWKWVEKDLFFRSWQIVLMRKDLGKWKDFCTQGYALQVYCPETDIVGVVLFWEDESIESPDEGDEFRTMCRYCVPSKSLIWKYKWGQYYETLLRK